MTVHGIPDACSHLGCYCPSKESNALRYPTQAVAMQRRVIERTQAGTQVCVLCSRSNCTSDKQLFKFTLARHNHPVATQGKWSFIGHLQSPSCFENFVVWWHIATFWSVFNRLQDCFGKVYCFPNSPMSTRPTTAPHSTTNNTTITKLDRVPHLQANAVTDQKIMVTDTDDDTQNILATAAALAKARWNIFLREYGDAGVH